MDFNLLLFGLGTPEIILVVLLFLLLFGAKRIPELMKNMGKGVKSFKEGMKDVQKEINTPDESDAKEPAQESEPESK
ncbi:MAG: twin-arginine translocase TatA/TatE family subunit [Bacteroidaceae bacterium]|nr:twin-arginine translocase TatA/TatE family subunit [Bacteroidaceae bacterium]